MNRRVADSVSHLHEMLRVENLAVEVDGKEILHDVSLALGAGEAHALFGPNGSGKTTLLMAVMGFPRYKIKRGSILFQGLDIGGLPLDERARLGVGMSFQRPPAVRGVRTRDLVLASTKGLIDGRTVDRLASKLKVLRLMDREVNYGFSGGEIKRSELLQLLAQGPRLNLLDEPDSGVDLVNMALIGQMISELVQEDKGGSQTRSALIITHSGHILDYVHASKGYVMVEGRIIAEGEALTLLDRIKDKGYEQCATGQS